MARSKATPPQYSELGRPATTPEGREDQLITLAIDLVEQRLRDGTASSQETTHFLKAASRKSRLEIKKLEVELELTKAKTEAIQSAKKVEELYEEAIKAFKTYSGQDGETDEDQDIY